MASGLYGQLETNDEGRVLTADGETRRLGLSLRHRAGPTCQGHRPPQPESRLPHAVSATAGTRRCGPGGLPQRGCSFTGWGGRTESKRSAGWLLRGALSDGQPQAALAGRGGSQQPSAPLGYRHISPCARLHGAFLCVRSAPLMRTQVPGFGLTLTQYNTSQPDHTRRDPASM